MKTVSLTNATQAINAAMTAMAQVDPVRNYYEFNTRKNDALSIITRFEIDCINYWKEQPEPAVIEEVAEQTSVTEETAKNPDVSVKAATSAPVKMSKDQLLDDLIAYTAIKLFHNRHQNIDEAFVEATLSTWGAEAFGTPKGEPDDIKEALMEYGRVMGEQMVKDQPPAQAGSEVPKEPLEIPVGSDARVSEDGTTLIVESHYATAMRDGERVIVDRKTGEVVEPKAKPTNTAMADALVAAKAGGQRQQHSQPKRDRHQRGER